MNKTSLTIGCRFDPPTPGSFYASDPTLVDKQGNPVWPGPQHNEFANRATAEKKAERLAKKSKRAELEASLVKSAQMRLARQGADPKDAALVVSMVEQIVAEQREALGFPQAHKPFHKLEGVRRIPPVSNTYTGDDSITSGTSGPAKDPAVVGIGTREVPNTSKRFANDGVSERYKKPTTVQIKGGTVAVVEYKQTRPGKKREGLLVGETKTWTAEVPICAQRFDDAGAYQEKHQNRLAQLTDIGKQAKGLRPHGLEKP